MYWLSWAFDRTFYTYKVIISFILTLLGHECQTSGFFTGLQKSINHVIVSNKYTSRVFNRQWFSFRPTNWLRINLIGYKMSDLFGSTIDSSAIHFFGRYCDILSILISISKKTHHPVLCSLLSNKTSYETIIAHL